MFLSGYFLIAATLLAVAVCLRRVSIIERELELARAKIDPEATPRLRRPTPRHARNEWSA